MSNGMVCFSLFALLDAVVFEWMFFRFASLMVLSAHFLC